MEKVLESWLHQWPLDVQFPDAKSSKLPFYQGMWNPNISCATPCTDGIHPNCNLPHFGLSGLPNFKLRQLGVPHGTFYPLPCFTQGPAPDLTLHEMILPNLGLPEKVTSKVDDTGIAKGLAQKQFLVFDHTGEKTTMIYSSGIDIPSQKFDSWGSKPIGYPNTSRVECHLSGTNLTNGLDEYSDTNEGSDMREDTEEINALLYSDDNEDYCSDDSEETSTGHSPSTMTGYKKQDWSEEDDTDEVASSCEPAKRQKLCDSGHEVLYSTNASSFVKPNRSRDYTEDAESSCAGGDELVQCSNNRVSLSGSKRHREEEILDTVRVLETVVPGVKGKDAVMVLDESINYLTLMKTSALSLGLSCQSKF